MNEAVKDAGRKLIGALLDSGNRAAASAMRSAFKDGKKVVREVDRRLGKALDRLGTIIDDEDDKTR